MENTEQSIRTLKDDPQYLGAFLNMARLNIFSISNHLSKELKISKHTDDWHLKEEALISSSFLANKELKKVNWNIVYALLSRFMPIVKVFDFESLPKAEQKAETYLGHKNYGKQFDEMSDTLKIIFKELNEFRNDYTHFYSTEKGVERKLIISNTLAEFLNINLKRAIAYTKERFKDVYKDADFELAEKIILFTPDYSITQEGIVFLTAMFLEREHAFQFIGKIKGLKGTQYKSFLATREALMAFCVRLPHVKFVSDDAKQALSLDIINELNRCPATLFDVITESEKVEFRPDLDEAKIKSIIENSTNEDVLDYDEYIQAITKKIRYTNRFPFYAMKFIDETEMFDKIRFQIDLGKIVIDEYPKKLLGADETRMVIDNAKAFGRLQQLNDEETVLSKINRTGDELSFEQFAPHYNADNNKIGIRFNDGTSVFIRNENGKKVSNKLMHVLPDAFLSLHVLPKIILLNYLKKGASEEAINDFIKLNNSKLFNRQFIEDIKAQLSYLDVFYKKSQGRKQKTAYLDKWKNDLLKRKQKLNEILEEHNLNDKQIPGRILDYWLNIKDVDESQSVSDRIKLMKRDCMDRLKAIKKGKAPKVGEMASFVAKDIVDMIIDKDLKGKITSFYYDKIQECLALYNVSEKRQLFLDMCSYKELNLLNTSKGHPFLKNINPELIKYPSDFYEKYLREKACKMVAVTNHKTGRTSERDQSWLAANFYIIEWSDKISKNMTVVKLPADKSKIPFSLCQLEKPTSTFDDWYNNIVKGKTASDKKKPIDLPTDIFDIELKNVLEQKLNEANISYLKDSNHNQLFKLWWTTCRKDGVQNFYKAEREYVIYDEAVRFTIDSKDNFADYYFYALNNTYNKLKRKRFEDKKSNRRLPDIDKKQVEKVFKSTIANTEKEIRLLQEEDRIMLLMLEKLLKNDDDLHLKLSNINELLNESITIKQVIQGKLSFDSNGEIIKGEKNEISKTITDTRKRKDFSVLRKFFFDRRLPELFEYINDDAIPLESLKTELHTYNKSKEQVFDAVFGLEEAIISKDRTGIENLFKTNNEKGIEKTGNIQHQAYLQWLLNKNLINDTEKSFLNMVRNTFSHNQFPQKQCMELFIPSWNQSKFAHQIIEVYNKKIADIIEAINRD